MPQEISGKGAANNPGVSTTGTPGQSLEEERSNRVAAAQRAVEKFEAQLKAAKEELANCKKGMN